MLLHVLHHGRAFGQFKRVFALFSSVKDRAQRTVKLGIIFFRCASNIGRGRGDNSLLVVILLDSIYPVGVEFVVDDRVVLFVVVAVAPSRGSSYMHAPHHRLVIRSLTTVTNNIIYN